MGGHLLYLGVGMTLRERTGIHAYYGQMDVGNTSWHR